MRLDSLTKALLIVGVAFLLPILVAGWVLAFTVAPGAITMAIGATIVAVPWVGLTAFSFYMDWRGY